MKKVLFFVFLTISVLACSVSVSASEKDIVDVNTAVEENCVLVYQDDRDIESDSCEVAEDEFVHSDDIQVFALTDASDMVIDEYSLEEKEDEAETSAADFFSEYKVNSGTTAKKLGKVSGFKVGDKFYRNDYGVYLIQLAWKRKPGADLYMIGMYDNKRAKDANTVRSHVTYSGTTWNIDADDIAHMLPRTKYYYFRVIPGSMKSGLGKAVQSKGMVIPKAGDAVFGSKAVLTRGKTKKGKDWTEITVDFANCSDRKISFSGNNRYLKVQESSGSMFIHLNTLKLKKSRNISPAGTCRLVYRYNGYLEVNQNTYLDFRFGYGGKTFTERMGMDRLAQ